MDTQVDLRRQAFIYNGNFNEKTAAFERLITTFLSLNSGNNRTLTLYVTSTGGYPENAFKFCDLIRKVQAEGHKVTIHLLGQLCSFNYLLATVADHFVMEPTASLTFSEMLVFGRGSLHKLVKYIAGQKEIFSKFVAAVVKRSNDKLDEATVRSWKAKHLTAQEALDLGLCDQVLAMPQGPIAKGDRPEHVVEINGLFAEDTIYERQIDLHIWLETPANAGRPIRVKLHSRGGIVVQALSLYGQLCEAQRMGHHVTIEVAGKAYSCALWFTTCALQAGTVEINSDSKLMFHEVSVEPLSANHDVVAEELSIHQSVYSQTCSLLCLAKGVTPELIKQWEDLEADHYITAVEAEQLGFGQVVERKSPYQDVETPAAPQEETPGEPKVETVVAPEAETPVA